MSVRNEGTLDSWLVWMLTATDTAEKPSASARRLLVKPEKRGKVAGSNRSYGGIGLGTLIAVLVSWAQWKSVGWAIVHGFLGWLYLIAWGLSCTASAPLGG